MKHSPRARQWVSHATIYAGHERLLSRHGGLAGVRDRGGIDSALARPQNLAAYGEPDVADLAAAYAFGLVRNHGFVDGNKRVAWLVAEVFLRLNGYRFECSDVELVLKVERLAAGEMTQEQFALWIRERLTAEKAIVI